MLAAWLLVCLGVAQASTPSSRAGTYTAVSIGSQSSVTAYKYDGAVAANDKAYFVPKALDAVGVYDSAGWASHNKPLIVHTHTHTHTDRHTQIHTHPSSALPFLNNLETPLPSFDTQQPI